MSLIAAPKRPLAVALVVSEGAVTLNVSVMVQVTVSPGLTLMFITGLPSLQVALVSCQPVGSGTVPRRRSRSPGDRAVVRCRPRR